MTALKKAPPRHVPGQPEAFTLQTVDVATTKKTTDQRTMKDRTKDEPCRRPFGREPCGVATRIIRKSLPSNY